MHDDDLRTRLSRISTLWTTLERAHGELRDEALRAQSQMLARYRQAAFRYLAAVVGDADAAEDLFQDFAVRFLRGDFRGASPERGRFRDYLKTSLIRLVIDYRRKRGRAQHAIETDVASPAETGVTVEESAAFEENWRGELLTEAWARLERESATGQPYHAVLRYRSEHPQATSEEMALALSAQLRPQQPFTDAGIRKILQRARERFADLLLDVVAASLESTSIDSIEQELIDLKLLPYCRTAVARRRGATP
jgi:RNA polymerase sigma-70 factor (ECF subfamily)